MIRGSRLEASCAEFNATGLLYLIDRHDNIAAITNDDWKRLPAHVLSAHVCRMSLREAYAFIAERRSRS